MVTLVHLLAVDLAQIQRTPCVVDVGQDERNQQRDKAHHLQCEGTGAAVMDGQ